MTTCARSGCEAPATHYPVLKVPDVGELVFGLQVCAEHGAVAPGELVGEKGLRDLRASWPHVFDFVSATVELGTIGDDRWTTFTLMQVGQAVDQTRH